MHEQDFTGGGFKWIDCNDHENSVVSLIRQDSSGEFVVGLFNFTPIARDGYRVGVPVAGAYNELINSDSEIYGGGNLGNAGVVFTEPIAARLRSVAAPESPAPGVPAAEARCRWSLIAVHCSRSALKGLATDRIPDTEHRIPNTEHRTPNTEYRIPNYELMPTIRSHCSSSTGMTDRRDMRTRANDSKNLSGFDRRERHRVLQFLHRLHVDRVELSGLVVRIRVRRAGGLRDAHHRLHVTRVIEEDAVALLDRAQVFLRERISDARPRRLAVTREVVVAVVGRLFLE